MVPSKTYGPTVRIKDAGWSIVIVFDNDPKFDMWNKATVRGMVPEFPGISGLTSIYEGQHVVGWMKTNE